MSLGLDKVKPLFSKLIKSAKRFEIILISLLVLILFGVALIQVNEAIDPTIDEAAAQKAQQDEMLKRVKYSDKSLRKIRELTNVEVKLEPDTGNHSDNPFSNE